MVFKRLGLPSIEVEKMISEATLNLETGTGKVLVNAAIIQKKDFEKALDIVKSVSNLNLNVMPSPLIAVKDEGETLGSHEIPSGYLPLHASPQPILMLFSANKVFTLNQ